MYRYTRLFEIGLRSPINRNYDQFYLNRYIVFTYGTIVSHVRLKAITFRI